MLKYYFRLALKSIRRNPVLSALMVLALALGIGAFMTTYTVYYLMSGNPIPHKSDRLLAVQLDNWDPLDPPTEGPEDVQPQLTYRDAMGLLESPDSPAIRQVAMYRSTMIVEPDNTEEPPFRAMVRVTSHGFFPMFEVPFRYGTGWGAVADDGAARSVVLSSTLNEQLFGGEDSVGRDIRLDDQLFRIVGVMGDWNPLPHYYDPHSEFADVEDIFLPFTTAMELARQTPGTMGMSGNVNCWKEIEGGGIDPFLRSECVWTQFWGEVDGPEMAEDYRQFLDNYVRGQKELGRFPRPLKTYAHDVMAWMDVNRVVSRDNTVLVRLSALFLLVCILNTVGILLAKFLGKGPEIALRRAMGASRPEVFRQNLFEVAMIGVLGGLGGIGLAYLGLQLVGKLYRGYEKLVVMDTAMLATAVLLAVASAIVAGLYPVWRTARLAPAGYLKTQ